jgi:hypothetical protein
MLRLALHPKQHDDAAAALDLLLLLPAAEQLPAAQVLRLLLAAVRAEPGGLSSNKSEQLQSNEYAVKKLGQLPGAWDVEEQDVLQLLHVAIERQPLLLATLLEMPLAKQLRPQAVLQLLQLTLAGAHTSTGSSSSDSRCSCVQQLLQLAPWTQAQQAQQRLQRQRRPSPSISPARKGVPRYPYDLFRSADMSAAAEAGLAEGQVDAVEGVEAAEAVEAVEAVECHVAAAEAGLADGHVDQRQALPQVRAQLATQLAAAGAVKSPQQQPAPAVHPAFTVQQLLQPEEAATLVRAALHGNELNGWRKLQILQALCEQLQSLRHLSSDAVKALVQEAVELGAWDALRCMRSSLPGAMQVMEAGLVAGVEELLNLEEQQEPN